MVTYFIVCLTSFIINIEFVSAITCSYYSYTYGYTRYYTCYSGEYCCGQGQCCYSSSGGVYSLWYFWFGIILFICICSGASGAYYHKRQRIHIRTAPAVTVHQPQQQTMVVSTTAMSGMSGYPSGYPAPPPTYNQAMGPSYPMGNMAPPPPPYHQPPIQAYR